MKKSKVLTLLIAFVLFMSLLNIGAANATPTHSDDGQTFEVIFVEDLFGDPDFDHYIERLLIDAHGEEFMQNHDVALSIAHDFHNALPQGRNNDTLYPEAFGGMYIADDGNLTIQVVGTATDDILQMSRSSNVNVVYVTYSRAELLEVWETIFDFMSANWQNSDCVVVQNINTASIDTFGNRVNVYLFDDNDTQIDLFKSTVVSHSSIVFIYSSHRYSEDDECLEFALPSIDVIYGVNEVEIYSDECLQIMPLSYDAMHSICEVEPYSIEPLSTFIIQPGSRIERSSGAARSIGFRARLNNEVGFVTAAHGTNPLLFVGEHFYAGTLNTRRQHVGTIRRINATTDTAFLALAPNTTMTIGRPEFAINRAALISVVGSVAIRVSGGGGASPLISEGRIYRLNHIHPGGLGPVITVRATYERAGGDSGGIIIQRLPTSSPTPQYGILGTHVGHHNVVQGVYSEISRINANLGTTLY